MSASLTSGGTRARSQKLLRSVTATGLAGATAVGALVAAPAAAATEVVPVDVALEASTTSLKSAGDYVALLTQVTDPDGAPAAGVDVTWYRKPVAGGGWETLKTSTTDAEGATSYGTAPDRGYRYDVITTATEKYAEGSPESITVDLDGQRSVKASLTTSATSVQPGQTAVLETRIVDDGGQAASVPIVWYRQATAGGGWEEAGRSGTDGEGRSTFGVTPDQGYRYDVITEATERYTSASPSSVTVDVTDRVAQMMDYAYSFSGVPYRWGGTTPSGFDCSGFTGYVLRHMGINLPRTSRDQRAAIQRIPNGQQQPGDLIFGHDSSGRVYHVTIYVGNGKTFGASRTGDVVRYSNVYGNYSVGRVTGL